VEIYEISKITNPKSKLSVVEKINHLIKLQTALLNKLDMLRQKRITPANSSQSRLPMGGSAYREKHSATDQEHHNSDIDEECTTKKEGVVKSVTPMTAESTAKGGEDTVTATMTATMEESEEEIIKASQKNSKRPKFIDEQ
jgi:hypothetical protein